MEVVFGIGCLALLAILGMAADLRSLQDRTKRNREQGPGTRD